MFAPLYHGTTKRVAVITICARRCCAKPDQFVQTLTEKLMTYALGRTVEFHDMPTVRRIVRETASEGYHFSSLVMHIINSEPFQMRVVPQDESAADPDGASRQQQ